MPGGYHFASEDEVTGHKDWILDTLEKWAVAKYDTGYVSMLSVTKWPTI